MIRDRAAKRCGSAALGVALLVTALLRPGDSAASFIQLDGTSTLEFRSDDRTLTVTGTYRAVNRGNETAEDVFVAFQLGQWGFATETRSFTPGSNHTWAVDESFEIGELACSGREGDLCADQQLPLEGIFPLRIARHYQDRNGYPFSAVSVGLVSIGELGAERRFATQIPSFELRWEMDPDSGGDFSGRLKVHNLKDAPLTVSLGLVLPLELTARTRPQQLELGGRASATWPLAFSNRAGLPGSAYQVFAVLQWEESGIRNTATVPQIVNLEAPEPPRQLLVVGVATGIAASVAFFALVWRIRRMRPS